MAEVAFPMLAVIVVLAILILVIMTLTRKRPHQLDVEKYRASWLKIENSIDKNNPMTFQMALLSADKLLDQALRDIGIPGENMGERLKSSTGKFSNINDVWTAHKIRNRIAHEPDAQIRPMVMRKMMTIYKRSLKELGAI